MLVVFCLVAFGCERDSDTPAQPTTEPTGSSPAHYGETPTTRAVVYPAAPKLPKPTETLAKGASCVTSGCHADYTRAAQIHEPIAERACDACHLDDQGDHKFPLKRDATRTCTFCHAVAGTEAVQHEALKDGCLTCHRAHTSNAKFLLKTDTIEQTCNNCHHVPLKKFAHDPFLKGDCTVCHQPHQAGNKFLLRNGTGSKQCFACHTGLRDQMTKASYIHKPASKDCNTCHDPHSTDNPRELRLPLEQNCFNCHKKLQEQVQKSNVQHAAMMQGDKCANCHNPHASDQMSLLKTRMDKVCLSCHDKPLVAADGRVIKNMKQAITESKFLHGPIKAGSCGGCHDPHGGQFASLLDRAFPKSFYTSFDLSKYALCFSCHEPQLVLQPKTTTLTGFRDGDKNLHYLHVNRDDKGRSCRSCHDIHGSNLPKHLASAVPFEGSSWAMPIEFEQTKDGGSCAPGCHKPRSYSRLTPTTLPTTLPTTRGVQ
jgi:predicted CXXCH cytochrome family protein